MRTSLKEERAKKAQRDTALKLAKKLHEAVKATNAFLAACRDAGEPGRGPADGRVILIENMTEYACYLDSVYGTTNP